MIHIMMTALILASTPTDRLANYIARRNPTAPARAIADGMISAGKIHGVDYRVLAAVAWIESKYRPRVRGKSHEVGVMQVRTVDLGLSRPWDALRRARVVPGALDRPWRSLSLRERARALEDVRINTYLGAWAIRNAVRVCYRLGHRSATWRRRSGKFGQRWHRDYLERVGHYNSGISWPRRGYMGSLRRAYRHVLTHLRK